MPILTLFCLALDGFYALIYLLLCPTIMTHFPLTGIIIHRAPDLFSFPIIILKLVLFFLHTWLCITTLDFCAYHVLPEFILSPHSALSLSDVEERCKQAAALRLPLSRMELNTEEVRELFQVRNPNITLITILLLLLL